MDESWDLWLNIDNGNSDYFLVAFIATKDPLLPTHIMRKMAKWMWKKKISIQWWVFHAYKETKESIFKLLELISESDLKIMVCVLNKRDYLLQWKFTKDTHLLYNNVTCKLLKSCIDTWILPWTRIIFNASRKETNRFLNKQFINHINDALNWIYNIDVQLKYPKQELWLQIVDTVAFSIYQKYENNNSEFYDMIKNHICIESSY